MYATNILLCISQSDIQVKFLIVGPGYFGHGTVNSKIELKKTTRKKAGVEGLTLRLDVIVAQHFHHILDIYV